MYIIFICYVHAQTVSRENPEKNPGEVGLKAILKISVRCSSSTLSFLTLFTMIVGNAEDSACSRKRLFSHTITYDTPKKWNY
jgi:hypothetical protein